MSRLTAGEIKTLVGGELRGDEACIVHEVAPLESAGPGAVSFIASARYLPYLQATRASVVLVAKEWESGVPSGCTAVVVEDPHQALYLVLSHFFPTRNQSSGIHPTAVIAASARVSPDVAIGAYSVIGEDVEIGPRSFIGPHVVVGQKCRIGADVKLHPQVTLYDGVTIGDRVVIHSGSRIGKEGFGFVWRDGGHRKVPQIGGCIIEDDVEIGSNVTIDRGSVGNTVVGRGSKVDNLVQLGHNVRLGQHVMLISQVGISGSTTVGDGAVLAGQAGVGGHLTIGPGARIGGQAGVTGSVPGGEEYSGYPARPHREYLRVQAVMFKLPELLRRLKSLEAVVFKGERKP